MIACIGSLFALSTAAQSEKVTRSMLAELEEDGINFSTQTFKDALKQAKEEDKLIFLDAYAAWCGPCKRMDRTTFKDGKVGAFFNENFINLKIDMEKGEGRSLSSKYRVTAYPTLFFIDGEGRVVKRTVGGQNAKGLLLLGKSVNDAQSE